MRLFVVVPEPFYKEQLFNLLDTSQICKEFPLSLGKPTSTGDWAFFLLCPGPLVNKYLGLWVSLRSYRVGVDLSAA